MCDALVRYSASGLFWNGCKFVGSGCVDVDTRSGVEKRGRPKLAVHVGPEDKRLGQLDDQGAQYFNPNHVPYTN